MSVTFPKIEVGQPVCHQRLAVFPLYTEGGHAVHYRMSDEALADRSVTVEEINDSGSVPRLAVENRNPIRVLFLEGEELVGAKQNRVLNTSVLVPAGRRIQIPVSCVEQGRWRRNTRHFASGGSHVPSKLRRALKRSVSDSLGRVEQHCSDQHEVWREIAEFHCNHAVSSPTGAMSDAYTNYEKQIVEFRDHLRYVDGANGMAVAVADAVVMIDLFDHPDTCRKVWSRLLSGVILDAIRAPEKPAPQTAEVQQLVDDLVQLAWKPAPAVGDGQEYRAQSARGEYASALALDATVVHGSVVAAG